jgi:PhnB protein
LAIRIAAVAAVEPRHDRRGSRVVATTGGVMSTAHKPDGYNSVSPYLIVDGAGRTIDFLTRVFGAVELRRFADPDGKVMHAEVRIDDTVVMLADGAEGWPPVPAYVHVYVKDVDATYKRALDAGASSVQEPVKKEDEDKRGGVKDPGGTTWWVSTRVG